MTISQNLLRFSEALKYTNAKLIAVSKTYPSEAVAEVYQAGHRAFGENKVQELTPKYEALPKDIEWHLIGHLQTNKVKFIAPFVHMIHSVDSFKLLKEIDKEAAKNTRIINVLLQVYIADEETKFGLGFDEVESIFESEEFKLLKNIQVSGFMGMATNTNDKDKIRLEFRGLKLFLDKCKAKFKYPTIQLTELSMGMSGDYSIAIEEGSTMIRVGSAIFGNRIY